MQFLACMQYVHAVVDILLKRLNFSVIFWRSNTHNSAFNSTLAFNADKKSNAIRSFVTKVHMRSFDCLRGFGQREPG